MMLEMPNKLGCVINLARCNKAAEFLKFGHIYLHPIHLTYWNRA